MLKMSVDFSSLRARLSLALLTTTLGILPATISSAQSVNTYEDYQLYCNKGAYYYDMQSPECDRYSIAGGDYGSGEKAGMDRQYQQFYLSQLEKLHNALRLADGAQNIDQLQHARSDLSKSIVQLEKIPFDVEIHPAVSQTLADARQHLGNIDEWLVKEINAAQQLAQAKDVMYEARVLTRISNTILQYKIAQAKWEDAKQQLDLMPVGLFVSDNVKTAQALASEQVASIQSQILILAAQEKRQGQVVQR